ncbi:gliding motility-associated C-terminal domain-containing protein [Mucilaginibacter terrae]|uniref:gliding motility-associated C-terminal domain-containing protein n=1 Tax=Mucilaginibacter terrae TaxID=1955052 RepID=UPI00363F15CF
MSIPYSNGLTVNSEGMLYLESNSQLYKIDPVAKKSTNLGNCRFQTSGDVIIYKGNLFMASTSGGIAKIDLADPSKNSLVIPMSGSVFGLASCAFSSTQNKIYAFDNVGFGSTNVIELDLDNYKTLGTSFTLPYSVGDAASEVEDGSLPEMVINNLKESAECPFVGKGTIQIICDNALVDYKYTLNGITNSTGLFSGLDPGTFQISVSTDKQKKDTVLTISKFTIQKPVTTITSQNPTCTTLGSVTVSSANDDGTYKIRYGSSKFALNHKFEFLNSGYQRFEIVDNSDCVVDTIGKLLVREKCTIQYDRLQITQECNTIRKGNIQVLTKTHFDLYTYILNDKISNTTGKFDHLKAGTYNIKIVSNDDKKEITAIIPDYSLTDPAVSYIKTNHYCAQKGEITFSLPINSANYKIDYKGSFYNFDNKFNNLTEGNYQFVILKPNGCVLDSVMINVVYEPCIVEIASSSVNQECNVLGKGVIQVTGMPIPEQYTYYLNNDISNSTGIFNMLEPGTYTVKVAASGGNSKQVTIEIPNYDLMRPKFSVTTKKPLCDIPGNIRLQVLTDPSLYSIEYKSSVYPYNFTFEDLAPGDYNFRILKKDGCIAEKVTVKLERESCNPVTFPNTFTPNGDGINDIFRPNEDSRATNYQLHIYNRYGSLLYASKDLHWGWDGKMKGYMMPVGTYYWLVSYTDEIGKATVQKGFVTLIQ